MLDDFIPSLELHLSSESDKKAAFEQAVGEDIYAQAILDDLADQYISDKCIKDIILAIKRTFGTKETNGLKLKSVEEIMEHLKQAADNWQLKQLSRIKIEHNYVGSSIADENNNESSSNSNDPSSKVYNLRVKDGNKYTRDCICCNDR